MPPESRTRSHGRVAAALAALAIAAATLWPAPSQVAEVARTPIWCVLCGDLGTVDVLLNLLLFVPLGLALRAAGLPLVRATLLAGGFSLAIELLQLGIPGRDTSLSDFLTNTAGAALGAWLQGTWRGWAFAPPRLARRLALGATLAWLGQTALTAYAVRPALPRSVYWGQIAPELEQFERFRGEVLSGRVGPIPMASRRLDNSAEVRRVLLDSGAVGAVAVPDGPTPGLAPIVSVFDREQREIVLLGQAGRDLVFRLRSHAFDLRLRPPAIRVPHAFPEAGGDTLRLAGRLSGRTLEAEARGSGPVRRAALDLSAQWGWSLLLPMRYYLGPEERWLSALWVAVWLVPIGYWTRRGRAGLIGPTALAAAFAAGVGLLAIPLAFGLRAPGWREWLAAPAGLLVGWCLARAAEQPDERLRTSGA